VTLIGIALCGFPFVSTHAGHIILKGAVLIVGLVPTLVVVAYVVSPRQQPRDQEQAYVPVCTGINSITYRSWACVNV